MISEFDSLPEAREHALEAPTPNGGSSFEALAEFDFRAQPDDTWDGFVIRQIKCIAQAIRLAECESTLKVPFSVAPS